MRAMMVSKLNEDSMMNPLRLVRGLRLTILLSAFILATPSFAARCGDFNSFVASMSAEGEAKAQAAGVSPGVTSGVSQDVAVLNFDRGQRYTFKQYVSARVGPEPA
jgi:hypothetical protein